MHLRRIFLITPAVLGLSITPALADTINYSFSALGATATFSLPSNPTPSLVGTDFFQINNVMVNIAGGGTFIGNLDFFDAASGGGAGSGVDRLDGPVLFSGDLSDPTLLTGMFALSGSVIPDPDGPVRINGTLNATAASTTPIPEPSSDLLFLSGCMGVVTLAWCRRRANRD